MTTSNRIDKVAIVGATGNSGIYMTEALLKAGKHTLTAITRADSQGKVPEGVAVKKIDYDKPETIVEALRGQDALIITLSGMTPKEVDLKLINAAGEAGVPWILPNEWGEDTDNEALVNDIFVFKAKPEIRKAIVDLGKSSYIALSTGFWYEWSLAMTAGFGFDLSNKKVTFFDDGETKIASSTWPQVGRAVASLLSLPIKPEGSNKDACLEALKNKLHFVQSFTISQRDMLQSVLRVTGAKEEDWTITKEPAQERYLAGVKELQEGKRIGMAKMMYTRVFYPNSIDHEGRTINHLLGLTEDSIDEATERAIEREKTIGQLF